MHVSIKRVTKRCPVLSCSVMFDFLRLMDYSPQGASVHGILQARIMEWLPCPPPGDLSTLGIEPRSPTLQAEILYKRDIKGFSHTLLTSYLPRVHVEKNSKANYDSVGRNTVEILLLDKIEVSS